MMPLLPGEPSKGVHSGGGVFPVQSVTAKETFFKERWTWPANGLKGEQLQHFRAYSIIYANRAWQRLIMPTRAFIIT